MSLLTDALAIWRAGVDAVRSDRLVREHVHCRDGMLAIGEDEIPLADINRIIVVGAGKAGAGMAAGLLEALGQDLVRNKHVAGWINVPDDCVRTLPTIHLHAARPAGVNEPTQAGIEGAERILEMVGGLGPHDLCICLLSGGGSALLPAPVDGVSLADKLGITKLLSGAGANIQELNTVRKQLSRIKGGRLAQSCRTGRLATLIISDVIGDPLDVIASGPTVPDSSTPDDALNVLDRFDARKRGAPASVFSYLERRRREGGGNLPPDTTRTATILRPSVIGNNATAVDAAGMEAERRGYSFAMYAANKLEGAADEVGRHLADMALRMRSEPGPDCLITGGEPTVELIDADQRGRGGRNQQLLLSAMKRIAERSEEEQPFANLALLSGGTDGEDGPTDAAGAYCDLEVAEKWRESGLELEHFLDRNDAYHFFQQVGGLLKTGPTHTNVCDIRVAVVRQPEA